MPLTKSMSSGSVVHDIVHSKNKMFKGDSTKQRIRRALAAYYRLHRNEDVVPHDEFTRRRADKQEKLRKIKKALQKDEPKKEEVLDEKKWIQKAVNPKHKGYCTPMTKPTCTPRRKALAKRFKSGDLSEVSSGLLAAAANKAHQKAQSYRKAGQRVMGSNAWRYYRGEAQRKQKQSDKFASAFCAYRPSF